MKELYLDGGLFGGTEKEFLTIDDFAFKLWMQDGELHRKDEPAVIYSDGREEWWQNGNRHRTDGPAIIPCEDELNHRCRSWYINNELTREDGLYCNSEKHYKNGVPHRNDGPSLVFNRKLWPKWFRIDEHTTKSTLEKRLHGKFAYFWHILGEDVSYLDDWFPMLDIFGGEKK